MGDADAAPSFSCPRCGTPVPVGATRCLTCAERGQAGAPPPPPSGDATATPSPPGSYRTIVALGCVVLLLFLVIFTGVAAVAGQKLREVQKRETNRQIQLQIDEERRRYETEQSHKGRAPSHVGGEAASELAVLGRPLPDLSGTPVTALTALEKGGVVVIYPMGCEDCTRKLAGAEKVLGLAKRSGLGAQLIVSHGTVEGVAKDNVPEAIRGLALLDADGKVAEALNVRHLTAIVVDSDGVSIVYRGTPEEAVGMVASVAQGE